MTDLPTSNSQIKDVTSFEDLVQTEFSDSVNAMCWKRELNVDFNEIIDKISFTGSLFELTEKHLNSLDLSLSGQRARQILINDFNLLKSHGAIPSLNIIKNYDRDDVFEDLPTDVYSFHVDRSPVATDTFLCTYVGESSDILPNNDAIQKVLIPEIRTKLKALYNGPESGFEAFLEEYFFDLHYAVKPSAQIVNLGNGHLWKLAVDHPKSKVLPCIHRAPKEKQGEKRLLLIS